MRIILSMFILFFHPLLLAQNTEICTSPNGKISVKVDTKSRLSFSVHLADQVLINRVDLNLIFSGEQLLSSSKYKVSRREQRSSLELPISYKDQKIEEAYNALLLDFKKISIEFRVYDEGLAYRYITQTNKEVEINEIFELEFPEDYQVWLAPVDKKANFQSSYEKPFAKMKISEIPDSSLAYLPLLMSNQAGTKLLITEADIYDYPHMFLSKDGEKDNRLVNVFPPFPLKTEIIGDRKSKVIQDANYVAKSGGDRTFPWRVFMLAEEDAQLVESNLVYLLSRELKLENTDWIKPGRVAWDWWNASNLYGVDFKAGLNTESYLYYIDFAAKYGLEYIILDEGWSISTKDLSQPNPKLDLEKLVAYAKEKNVRLILWATWVALNGQWEVLDKFQEWDIAGIKVDFMDRSDQWIVHFYEKVAQEAAQRKLLVDFHGAFKPVGLRRAYPNVVSYEGVYGLEQSKWSKLVTPEHDVNLPFIRMVCGPMDYTPGAMRNYHPQEFQPNFTRPGSQGTRCHQVALFIVYESGIQMFCDSPSNYEREAETTRFLSSIPVTWDETRVLEAKVGEYLILARRKGKQWFIGGINGGEAKEFDLDLSFLEDKNYQATVMLDGINSDLFAEDYRLVKESISQDKKLKINMHKHGGFAIRLEE